MGNFSISWTHTGNASSHVSAEYLIYIIMYNKHNLHSYWLHLHTFHERHSVAFHPHGVYYNLNTQKCTNKNKHLLWGISSYSQVLEKEKGLFPQILSSCNLGKHVKVETHFFAMQIHVLKEKEI